MKYFTAFLFTVLAAVHIYAQQGGVVLRMDRTLPKGETVEVHSLYKGRKLLLTSFKTQGQDSVMLQNLDHAGLYFVSLKGFGNYAEFIYNPGENMVLEANGELPNGMIAVVNSKENTCYADLLRINTAYDRFLDSLRQLKRNLPFTTPDYYGRSFYLDSLHDAVAREKNGRLTLLQYTYPQTYTATYLVPFALVPVASMQELSAYQSPDAYCSYFYFKFIQPAQAMLFHYAMDDAILKYLSTFTQPGEEGAKKSIDYVVKTFATDTAVSGYVANFLVKTFLEAKSPDLALYVMGSTVEGCSVSLGERQAEYLSNYQHVQIGNQVDDIVLNNIRNEPVSLSNTCKKGQVTVLLFWTSWCLHCKKMLPELKPLLAAYKGKVQVFAISLDEIREDWTAFVDEHDLDSWVHVSELKKVEKSSLAPRFMVAHTPTVFLLDADRKILARNLDKTRLMAAIAQYMH